MKDPSVDYLKKMFGIVDEDLTPEQELGKKLLELAAKFKKNK